MGAGGPRGRAPAARLAAQRSPRRRAFSPPATVASCRVSPLAGSLHAVSRAVSPPWTACNDPVPDVFPSSSPTTGTRSITRRRRASAVLQLSVSLSPPGLAPNLHYKPKRVHLHYIQKPYLQREVRANLASPLLGFGEARPSPLLSLSLGSHKLGIAPTPLLKLPLGSYKLVLPLGSYKLPFLPLGSHKLPLLPLGSHKLGILTSPLLKLLLGSHKLGILTSPLLSFSLGSHKLGISLLTISWGGAGGGVSQVRPRPPPSRP